jgi:hypothetical protein
MYNLIGRYSGPVQVRIMGLAASMASYIALAGRRVTAEANSVYMIHNVLGGALGNHHDLRQAASVFEKFSTILAKAYSDKTGLPLDEIRSMMDAETWFTADEAKAAGFVDVVEGKATEARERILDEARATYGSRPTAQAPDLDKLAASLDAPLATPEPVVVLTPQQQAAQIRASYAQSLGLNAAQVADARVKGMNLEEYALAAVRTANPSMTKSDVAALIASGMKVSEIAQYSKRSF